MKNKDKIPIKQDSDVLKDEKKNPHRSEIRSELLKMMSLIREFSIEWVTLNSILNFLDERGYITEKQSRSLSRIYLMAYDNKLMKK